MKSFLLAFFTMAALAVPSGWGQSKIDLHGGDSVRTVLEQQVGKPVELRMKSGEKISGKLQKVTEKMAHVSELTDADFYDAAVDIDSIAAVVVRVRSN
ncbi:MAG: hypothetical protein M3Q46_06515 [Verrucomicrobiota bacterium]|nr:hypothetical protein [Verrucomicrobiota bacterium]